MAMNEELLASIDDRLMQLVEEMKELRKALLGRDDYSWRVVPEKPAEDPKIIEDIERTVGKATARRLGLSPEKKRLFDASVKGPFHPEHPGYIPGPIYDDLIKT